MENRIGEESIASNGQKMTIIAYRNFKDIDIKFEDGVIVKNKSTSAFKKGLIKNPMVKNVNLKSHLGEIGYSKNGQKMEIIKYNASYDIDVKFEDGTIVKNKQYVAFKKQEILNPNYYKDKFTGLTVVNNNGLKMTIIEYKNSHDFDIEFEDGVMVNCKSISNFRSGKVLHPNTRKDFVKTKIGETSYSSHNEKMTIIEYRNANDVDVKFEDGTIIKNRSYKDFRTGNILNPNFYSAKIGEIRFSNDGQKMTLIAYRSSKDVDVKFEDGTIITNKQYSAFKNGKIKNPNSRIGETSISSIGQKMTIIAYRSCIDLDVQFEDGSIAKNRTYGHFQKGDIANPNFYKNMYVGKTTTNGDGFKMTIIAYRNIRDIDVEFEDGTIVKNKQYNQFEKGCIGHPKKMTLRANKRIGETAKAYNGQKMTIVAYRRCDDIDIKFEDGTIVYNKKYDAFRAGEVKNPNFHEWQIGEEAMSSIGLKIKLIKYTSHKNIDIEFEDGYIVKGKSYSLFKRGKIGHPYIKNNGSGIPFLYINNISGKMLLNKYFNCKCSKCGLEAIMTFEEAKNHKC